MKKVLVFGTFDGLHEGHLNLFKQARQYGEHIIVVVARDSTVLKNKGRFLRFNEQERLGKVKECGLVNEALLGTENHDTHYDSYELIGEIKPDVVCLGYDQAQFKDKLREELKRMDLENVEIIVLEPHKPEMYKSSILNK